MAPCPPWNRPCSKLLAVAENISNTTYTIDARSQCSRHKPIHHVTTFVTAGWQEREVFVVRAEGRPARIIGDSASIRSAYCRLAIVPRLLTVHTNVLTLHFTGYLLSQPHSRHRLLACTKLSSAPLGARITRYIPVCLSACSSLYADRHLENEKSYNVQTLRRGCPRHE